jgi:hypothetical protein
MLVPEDKKMMRNKKFVGTLVFGVVCALVGMIVLGIYNLQDSVCIDDSFCPEKTSVLRMVTPFVAILTTVGHILVEVITIVAIDKDTTINSLTVVG